MNVTSTPATPAARPQSSPAPASSAPESPTPPPADRTSLSQEAESKPKQSRVSGLLNGLADAYAPASDKEKPAADKEKPAADKDKPAADKEKPAADKEKPTADKPDELKSDKDYSVKRTDRGDELGRAAREAGKDLPSDPGGNCYKGVKEILEKKLGIKLEKGSAWAAADQLARNPKFNEVKDLSREDLKRLPPGAVVVWDCNGLRHQHGHISISDGRGKEVSDHNTDQRTNYGSTYRVFMPRDTKEGDRAVPKQSWLDRRLEGANWIAKYYSACGVIPGPRSVFPGQFRNE